jgi:hypothetical protein
MNDDSWLVTLFSGFISFYQLMLAVVMRPLLLTSITIGWTPAVALGLKLYLRDMTQDESEETV